MSKAEPKKKLLKFEVMITRHIEHTAVVEVEAYTSAEAISVANDTVDTLKPSVWREGDLIDGSAKAKLLND